MTGDDVTDSTHTTAGDATDPLVRVRGLAKSFGDNRVLRDIDLDVAPGSVTVVIGPSGSGKTTLLRCLNALEIPDQGTVEVAGVTVDFGARHSPAELRLLRAQSGMVFQSRSLSHAACRLPFITMLCSAIFMFL